MTTLANLLVKVGVDAADVDRGISQADSRISSFASSLDNTGRRMQQVGGVATVGLTLPLLGLANAATNAASDLNESMNAIGVVFGTAVGKIQEFGKTSAQTVGLSTRAFNELVTPVGAALVNVGFSQDQAADSSINLARRAADMASVFNTDVSTAMEAIQAGLRGEADPIERFGVGLSDAAVTAQAMAMGLGSTADELDANDKAQARLALIMQQTDKYAGDFANTSGELANQQRITAAEAENQAAAFGEKLIPVKQRLIEIAGNLLARFSELSPGMQNMILVVGGLAVAFGPLLIGVGSAIQAFTAITTLLMANPWILVAAAVIALAIVIVKNWDTIRDAIVGAWNTIWEVTSGVVSAVVGFVRDHWQLIVGFLTGPIGFAVALVITHWDTLWRWTFQIFNYIGNFIASIPGWVLGSLSWLVNGIGGIFRWAFEIAIGVVQWGVNTILWLFGSIPWAIWNALNGLGQLLWDLISGAINAVVGALNWLIGIWNDLTFPKVTVGPVSFGGWSLPNLGYIPYLASGGIVRRATLALIGEAGPEAVVPLDDLGEMLRGSEVAVPEPADPARVIFDFMGADSELGRALRKMIRVEGGDVQAAFT